MTLRTWMNTVPDARFAPLFAADGLTVRTHIRGREGQRKLLTRSATFDEAVIEVVEAGLAREDWTGLLYVMGVGAREDFTPLYVGKAERRGVKHELSRNLANIRGNPERFARWGYGLAYHVGDLSQALFEFKGYQRPQAKYKRWATALFSSFDPPVLKAEVSVLLVPWFEASRGPSGFATSLPAAEKEVIALASALFGEVLLNVDGR